MGGLPKKRNSRNSRNPVIVMIKDLGIVMKSTVKCQLINCLEVFGNCNSKDVINNCQVQFHFDAISDIITKRKQIFLNK